MIKSSSISCHSFLTSLILSNEEILVEYKLMTCLPKAFPVFSPFSFSLPCLYSVYVLLIVLLLALSTFSCVHLPPNKYVLMLLMALLKHFRFLCCPILSFGVSTVSPKNSSLFSIFSISAIMFSTCGNQHHMKNHIRKVILITLL